jgi:hypothetical protein
LTRSITEEIFDRKKKKYMRIANKSSPQLSNFRPMKENR